MSGHEEVLVPDDDYVAKKRIAVGLLSGVVAGVSAAVSRTPQDSGLRLTLVSCMRLLGRAEVELDEATKAVRGPEDVAS